MDNKWTQYIHYFGLYLIPASIVSGFLIAFCYAIANTYGTEDFSLIFFAVIIVICWVAMGSVKTFAYYSSPVWLETVSLCIYIMIMLWVAYSFYDVLIELYPFHGEQNS